MNFTLRLNSGLSSERTHLRLSYQSPEIPEITSVIIAHEIRIIKPVEGPSIMLVPIPFPLELWEEIVYSVDSSRDLLSLALVSKFFDSIIIPHHIQYRNICCDLRRTYVWAHLIDNRRRTKGIRCLKLVDEREHGTQLPPLLVHPTTPYTVDETHAVSLLVQSLLFMTALERFEWKYPPGGILNIVDISRLLVDKATSLRALSLDFEWPSNTEDSSFTDVLNSLPVCFSTSTRFYLFTNSFP